MQNIKIVIPARYDSTRLPGKPLLKLKDREIVLHVIDRCMEAGFHKDNIIVATENKEILTLIVKNGFQAQMTSSEHQSGTDRISQVANSQAWPAETTIINVQGDEPFIPSELLKQVAQFKMNRSEFDIVTAVTPINTVEDFTNINTVKAVSTQNGAALYFTRSPVPLNRESIDDYTLAKRHVGIYAYSKKSLDEFCNYPESCLEKHEKLEQLRALDNGMSIGVTEYLAHIPHGVDTLEDFEALKQL